METEQEVEGVGWTDDWFAQPWDDEDYEPDLERQWEKMTWVDDLLVPLDSTESLS